jgi:hemolysin activation/secretion protein
LVLSVCHAALGQVRPGIDPTGRSGDRRPDILEEMPDRPPPRLGLPPPTPPEKEGAELPLKTVYVKELHVVGSTVFSQEELAAITAPYTNRELTTEDLETVRRALTVHYINKGYVNSGAVIPDQVVADGVITIQIVEGNLTHIEVEGNKWFGDAFIQDRIALGADAPVNVSPLQTRLQLLQLDTRIQRIKAELKPGLRPGESVLHVDLEERLPFFFWLGFNNYQSPSVGAERGLLTLAHQSLTGRGDILSLTYGRSEGLRPQLDAWYTAPLNARDTSILLRYRKNDFDVVKRPFQDLNIESESDVYELTLRHPFYRSLNQEFALALTGEHLRNQSFLLNEPFSFSLGEELGESVVTALRFSQHWTYRTRTQVMAARSRFSVGIDALNATDWDFGLPDGEFFSWLGQFQWAKIFKPWDVQLLFRGDVQLSDDPLLALEQIAVGGRYTVRGYRENLLVRDKGLILTLESRIPLARNHPWADSLYLIPFFDYGAARNEDRPTPPPESIYSAGLGLRWEVTLIKSPVELKLQSEFFWGYALRDVEVSGEYDLQDDGIHFQVALTGF